jgi:hypothetical protein
MMVCVQTEGMPDQDKATEQGGTMLSTWSPLTAAIITNSLIPKIPTSHNYCGMWYAMVIPNHPPGVCCERGAPDQDEATKQQHGSHHAFNYPS